MSEAQALASSRNFNKFAYPQTLHPKITAQIKSLRLLQKAYKPADLTLSLRSFFQKHSCLDKHYAPKQFELSISYF